MGIGANLQQVNNTRFPFQWYMLCLYQCLSITHYRWGIFFLYHTSCVGTQQHLVRMGEPCLVDRVLALHAGSRGFDSHRRHMSERFFRSNRQGYPHPVSSELEKSGIRVAVGDCSVTERRRWRPPYQTGKTVHVHAKHYKHNEDGRTAPGVCGNGSVPLSHSGNVVTRIGTHTHALWSVC